MLKLRACEYLGVTTLVGKKKKNLKHSLKFQVRDPIETRLSLESRH